MHGQRPRTSSRPCSAASVSLPPPVRTAVGRVWGGYPRISGLQVSVLGFSLCPQVFGFGYPKSNEFGADLNLYPRIHRRGSGKQHELPSKAADPAWPHTSSPRPIRLAAGALLRMGQSKAARPEAAPTGVDRPEAGPWPKASRQPARGRVQQLQSKQRAQQGFTAQPVSAQPHTVKQYRMVCELFSGFG